ncbi:MAG: hypothetical protein ACOX52_01300 [Verrucomicrobiota bacterium]
MPSSVPTQDFVASGTGLGGRLQRWWSYSDPAWVKSLSGPGPGGFHTAMYCPG